MEVYEFTQDKISNLEELSLYEKDFNSDSDIYRFKEYVLKFFMTDDDYLLYEKKHNLDALIERRQLIEKYFDEFLLPLFYINKNNKFKGFGMEYIDGMSFNKLFDDSSIPLKEKFEIVIKLGELLERMSIVRKENSSLRNFFINDIHCGNLFVTKDGKIKVGDIDSVKIIERFDFDSYYLSQTFMTPMLELEKYDQIDGKIICNEQSEIYCYIMILIKFMTGIDVGNTSEYVYMDYLEKMAKKGFDSELLEYFARVYKKEDNINPYPVLQKIKIENNYVR